jgi:hypothetical protein
MDAFAVVPQGQLLESFGIAHYLCPFGPRITVAMQSDATDAEAVATLPELGGHLVDMVLSYGYMAIKIHGGAENRRVGVVVVAMKISNGR